MQLPPPRAPDRQRVVIFDLDETLVHCVENAETDPSDIVVQVVFETGDRVNAGINVRPMARECLQEVSELFQVGVFTASHKSYADAVLDVLDPRQEWIDFRLYREHCVETEDGVYIKDLRVIGNRDLQNVVLVDNAAYSFGYQLDNGIPIIPFFEDKGDLELVHLVEYLRCLLEVDDVREQNRRAFQLADLKEDEI